MKVNLKILLISFALFGLSFLNVYSQTNDWILLNRVDNVDISSGYFECRDESQGFNQEFVLLRFKNNNDYPVKVVWQLEAWYENKCATCGIDEYRFELIVPAGDAIFGDCNFFGDSKLKIFSKFLDIDAPVSLEKFNIVDVSVSKI